MSRILEKLEAIKQDVVSELSALSTTLEEYLDLSRIGTVGESDKVDSTFSDIVSAHKTQIEENKFTILVLGEFSCGKSTFLNALIGEKILPVSVKPTTATINEINYGDEKGARLHFWGPMDDFGNEIAPGKIQDIPIDQLRAHTTSLTPEADERSEKTKLVEIFYPVEYCKNSVTIVDTPGFNSVHKFHDKVTFNYLTRGNAVIWLLNPMQPLSGSERAYLRSAKHHISKILFVVPKVDLLEDEDRQEVWSLFEKEIPAETGSSLPVKLFPINAKLAAKGDWDESHFGAFIEELESFLWSDEKTKETLAPGIIGSIGIAQTVLDAIDVAEASLRFSPEEFESRVSEYQPQLARVRQKRSDLSLFKDSRMIQFNAALDREVPLMVNKKLGEFSQFILDWEGNKDDLKAELTEKAKEIVMDISFQFETIVKENFEQLRAAAGHRFHEFVQELKSVHVGISSSLDEGEVERKYSSAKQSSGNEELLIQGGSVGIGVLAGICFTGVVGVLAVGIGSFFLGGWLGKIDEKRILKELEEELASGLRTSVNDEVEVKRLETLETIDGFFAKMESEMTNMVDNLDQAISSVRSEAKMAREEVDTRQRKNAALKRRLLASKNALEFSLIKLSN